MSKLVEYREKLNLTQEELSEKAELSVRTIQRIEAGAEPKGHTLKVLAKALNITENTLLGIEEIIDGINYKLLKLINTSSLLFVILPPMNIIMPLIIMIFKKQSNQIVFSNQPRAGLQSGKKLFAYSATPNSFFYSKCSFCHPLTCATVEITAIRRDFSDSHTVPNQASFCIQKNVIQSYCFESNLA